MLKSILKSAREKVREEENDFRKRLMILQMNAWENMNNKKLKFQSVIFSFNPVFNRSPDIL